MQSILSSRQPYEDVTPMIRNSENPYKYRVVGPNRLSASILQRLTNELQRPLLRNYHILYMLKYCRYQSNHRLFGCRFQYLRTANFSIRCKPNFFLPNPGLLQFKESLCIVIQCHFCLHQICTLRQHHPPQGKRRLLRLRRILTRVQVVAQLLFGHVTDSQIIQVVLGLLEETLLVEGTANHNHGIDDRRRHTKLHT